MSTKRRRLRAVLPPAVALFLIAVTVAVHVSRQSDPTDRSFLSPISGAGDGAERLADRLAAAGIRIDRRTDTPAALQAARTGSPATVLVTTPGLVNPGYLRGLSELPAGTRVVLVAPDARVLDDAGLAAEPSGPRWAAAAPEPDCAAGYPGPAAVLRWRYTWPGPGQQRCYAGGVAEQAAGTGTVTLVGAADAFRNDRAGEHANQAFATTLLSRAPRVVWLDLHEHEKPPPFADDPSQEQEQAQEQDRTVAPRPGDGDGDNDGESGGGDSGSARGGGPGAGQQGEGDGNPLAGSPLGQAFPPAVWATLFLLALAGMALAAASARRLGAPVTEPLPVLVRAAETVRGLGGLYRRARARDTSLATLQSAAVRRLAGHFGLPSDTTTADVAERVAAYTGQPVDEVRAVLGATVQGTDRELTQAATAVQQLVRQVTRQQVINEGNAL